MVVPSSAREEKYGWLGQFAPLREWIGPRVVNNLSLHDYSLKNRVFETTVAVARDDFEDDQLGTYAPMFGELGRSAAEHPDRLVFDLLKAGFSQTCYDGQYFFDTDHPVTGADGVVQSVANTDGGGGTPWFLLDTSRAVKPMIYQERRAFRLIRKDREEDDNVFMNRELIYGVDGRCNVGFGLWQLAWGSKQTLNAENYAEARSALMGFRGDTGRPLGVRPTMLVVPPSLESAGRKLLNSELASGGESNEWKGTAALIVTPWLA